MIYYTILTDEQLTMLVPDDIKAYMTYTQDYTLGEAIFGTKLKTVDGRWLCDCRLRTEYKETVKLNGVVVQEAPGISNNCTKRFLTEEEVEKWKGFVGADNVFTDISGIELIPEQDGTIG